MVEVVRAPGGGLPGHSHDRSQRGGEQPAGGDQYEHQDESAQDERGEQRQLPCLLIGGERDAGDDRAQASSAAGDGGCIKACVAGGDIEKAWPPARQRLCGLLDVRCGSRLFECSRSAEYPEVCIGGAVVGRFAQCELSAAGAQGVDLRYGACTDEVARVAVEHVRENEVEAADETDERCQHGDADRELQPAAETEALHVIL